jgi:hypothetical protein
LEISSGKGWVLPQHLEGELREYVAEVAAHALSHGRLDSFCDYIVALLNRLPEERLSKVLGGSRSKRYETARKLVTRSPWTTALIADGMLHRLQRLIQTKALRDPVLAIDAMGLRTHLDDDEPRYNYLLLSVAFPNRHDRLRRDFPLLGMLVRSDDHPGWDAMSNAQVHLLDHVSDRLGQRRLLPFGALSPVSRYWLHIRGWEYMQHVPDPGRTPYDIRFCRDEEALMDLTELAQHVTPGNLRRGRFVQFNGEISVDGSVPDWEETVIADPRGATSSRDLSWCVTNREPSDSTLDLADIANMQSYIAGHVDLLGAGMYRGPTHEALLRHLALANIAIGFVMERAVQGCLWGLRREHAAARRYMDRFLRESAALNVPITAGERRSADEVLRPLDQISLDKGTPRHDVAERPSPSRETRSDPASSGHRGSEFSERDEPGSARDERRQGLGHG